MNRNLRISCGYLLAGACALWAASAAADIKCWINRDGVRECGHVVPPEYSQQEHTELSNTGVTTGTTGRAPTAEELEQERQAAVAKAEEERKLKERAAADRQLLQSYSSEEEIIKVRDDKLADVESRIRHAEKDIARLNKNLSDIIEDAAARERRGEQPDAKTAGNIESVRAQIRDQEALIAAKRGDQDAIRKQYDADLERYRDMTATATATAGTPSQETETVPEVATP